MTQARQYLLDYLEEEFSRQPSIRVRVVPLSEDEGVTVRTQSREYFFPFEWADKRRFDEINRLVKKIQELYEVC